MSTSASLSILVFMLLAGRGTKDKPNSTEPGTAAEVPPPEVDYGTSSGACGGDGTQGVTLTAFASSVWHFGPSDLVRARFLRARLSLHERGRRTACLRVYGTLSLVLSHKHVLGRLSGGDRDA